MRGDLGGLLGLPISFYRRVPAECFGRQSRLVQSEPLLRPERNVGGQTLPEGCEMTTTRTHVLAIVAAVLFSLLEPSFAMSRSRHPSSARFQGATNESRGVVTSPSRVPAFDPRGSSAYPFGRGVNFPYPDRPYGDPDHW